MQQLNNLFIFNLRKCFIELSDRIKICRFIDDNNIGLPSWVISETVSGGATGTATIIFFAWLSRPHRIAAFMVAPVAIPSSTKMTVFFSTDIGWITTAIEMIFFVNYLRKTLYFFR